MTELRNRINKNELKVRLAQEQIERVTRIWFDKHLVKPNAGDAHLV